MVSLIQYVHTLAVAVLVGKVILLSCVVAPILAKHLEHESFRTIARQLFPAYHAMGIGAAVAGLVAVTGLMAMHGLRGELFTATAIWILVLLAEAYCRSPLTSRSTAMRDRLREQESRGAVDPGLQGAWNRLHPALGHVEFNRAARRMCAARPDP